MSFRLLICGVIALVSPITSPATSLGDEPPNDQLVSLVITFLNDSDKEIRALAFAQVRTQAKGEAATRKFAAQLFKLPVEGQVGLLSALAGRGDKAARPDVLKFFAGSKDSPARVAAITALGAVGGPEDLPFLIGQLAAGTPKEIKAAAFESLSRLGGSGVPQAIAASMTKAPPPLRVMLINILAKRRALDTRPEMLSAAIDENAAVRTAAMDALGRLASAEHIAGMVQGILRAEPGRERSAAEKSVMFVCDRIPDAQRRAEPLLAAMDKLSSSDRTVLLSALGRVGGPSALKVVESAIASRDSVQHEMGIRAICNWPNASVSKRLIELAREDDHADHQARALRALIRVAPLLDKRSAAEKLTLLKLAMSMCKHDKQRHLALRRAAAIRIPETLRFLLPYVDQPADAETACLSIVELAHHRGLRVPNQAEFDRALDKVIKTSKDAVVVDRARRYKKDQTWVRPAKGK